jgi:hypothetical protein
MSAWKDFEIESTLMIAELVAKAEAAKKCPVAAASQVLLAALTALHCEMSDQRGQTVKPDIFRDCAVNLFNSFLIELKDPKQ